MVQALLSLRSIRFITPCLVAAAVGACVSGAAEVDGDVPTAGAGGSSSGATGASGGKGGSATGGTGGGSKGGSGGTFGGGTGGTGGKAAGGSGGTSGTFGGGGKAGKGGGTGTGGSSTGGASGDPCSVNTPLTGGEQTNSSNDWGMAGGLAWTIWSNGSGGSITTYDFPAFKAAWNNSGDFLARIGLQWNATRTYDQYGTITAEFNSKKSGTAGSFSYVGIYGWSISPCVEYYIVDDSYNRMPVNPGNTTNNGTANIDGGTYTLYTRNTTGTGGSKCPGTSNWAQYYSIRQTARTCGIISITEHFDAWAQAGMPLGMMDQAQILIEAGGGVGSIEFPVANVTATMP